MTITRSIKLSNVVVMNPIIIQKIPIEVENKQ